MGTNIKCDAENVALTRFYAGVRGQMVSVSVEVFESRRDKTTHWHGHQMIELTREQAESLARDLMDFAQYKEQEV